MTTKQKQRARIQAGANKIIKHIQGTKETSNGQAARHWSKQSHRSVERSVVPVAFGNMFDTDSDSGPRDRAEWVELTHHGLRQRITSGGVFARCVAYKPMWPKTTELRYMPTAEHESGGPPEASTSSRSLESFQDKTESKPVERAGSLLVRQAQVSEPAFRGPHAPY